jgi:hypothetical protein
MAALNQRNEAMHVMLTELRAENADLRRQLAVSRGEPTSHEPYISLSSAPPAPRATAVDAAPSSPGAKPFPMEDVDMPGTPPKRAVPGRFTAAGAEVSPEKSEPKRLRSLGQTLPGALGGPGEACGLPMAVLTVSSTIGAEPGSLQAPGSPGPLGPDAE